MSETYSILEKKEGGEGGFGAVRELTLIGTNGMLTETNEAFIGTNETFIHGDKRNVHWNK